MYKPQDRQTKPLFTELMPFGGQLDESNRWLRIAGLIPWEKLESEYASHFSRIGRPATDGRLFAGLMLLKHMTENIGTRSFIITFSIPLIAQRSLWG